MKVCFIDSEPPGRHGGGIRTYIRKMIIICREAGIPVEVYTHNCSAYDGCPVFPIGRRPLRIPGLRRLMYRFFYHQNVIGEHSRWLAETLGALPADTVAEFCDYGGYAAASLTNTEFKKRICIRIHTPEYIIRRNARESALSPAGLMLKHRETECLKSARHLSAPSACFVRENLPWLKKFDYLPNPLPRLESSISPVPDPIPPRFLYLGRIEERKGVRELLSAFESFCRKEAGAELTLAGSWPDSAYARSIRIRAEAMSRSRAGRIRIMGAVPAEQVSGLFKSHSYCIIPSLWENSPYSFFEALSADLFCIGSNTGEMGHVLAEIGGAAVEPGSSESLAETMIRIHSSPGEYRRVLASQRRFLADQGPKYAAGLVSYYRSLAGEF